MYRVLLVAAFHARLPALSLPSGEQMRSAATARLAFFPRGTRISSATSVCATLSPPPPFLQGSLRGHELPLASMWKCLGDVRVLNFLVPHKWMGKSTRPGSFFWVQAAVRLA